jgi:hypothetical protein
LDVLSDFFTVKSCHLRRVDVPKAPLINALLALANILAKTSAEMPTFFSIDGYLRLAGMVTEPPVKLMAEIRTSRP